MSTLGNIHSLESFGTQEGPGIRYVVFMQGCPARCRYCQNPDTWPPGGGRPMSVEDVFAQIEKCVPYFAASGGGVTASGGEPLMQSRFLTELFARCQASGIHTAIGTAGFIAPAPLADLDPLLELTDLFLVDLKASDPAAHTRLSGRALDETLKLIERLEVLGRPYWVRQVLVPGLNDTEEALTGLRAILTPLRHCARFEFLPYHTLGIHKWEALGLTYPLVGVRPAMEEDLARAERILQAGTVALRLKIC